MLGFNMCDTSAKWPVPVQDVEETHMQYDLLPVRHSYDTESSIHIERIAQLAHYPRRAKFLTPACRRYRITRPLKLSHETAAFSDILKRQNHTALPKGNITYHKSLLTMPATQKVKALSEKSMPRAPKNRGLDGGTTA